MDLAFCVLDNMTYTSAQFSKLNFADMSEKRRSLACPECKGSAFLEKKLETEELHASVLVPINLIAAYQHLTKQKYLRVTVR